jgi:hypothetical protein
MYSVYDYMQVYTDAITLNHLSFPCETTSPQRPTRTAAVLSRCNMLAPVHIRRLIPLQRVQKPVRRCGDLGAVSALAALSSRVSFVLPFQPAFAIVMRSTYLPTRRLAGALTAVVELLLYIRQSRHQPNASVALLGPRG